MRISMRSELSDDDLHLLYLDWCSSRVASRFLELTHDEVWLRSHSAASLDPDPLSQSSSDGRHRAALDRIPGYLDLVRKTALLLADELNLPAFPEWRVSYLQDPAVFDLEMLGRE